MNIKSLLLFLLFSGCLWGVSSQSHAQAVGGPGTEMTKIINRIGLGSDCGRCKALAAEMDQGGSNWVRQNFNYVVNRTTSNAQNLGHTMGPIRKVGVRMIVRRSIQKAR